MLLADFLLLLILLGSATLLPIGWIRSNNAKKALADAPPGAAVGPGDTKATAEIKVRNYRLLTRAVTSLDHLMSDEMVRPLIPERMQKEIQSIIDEFYE